MKRKTFVNIVTPMRADHSIDYESFNRLIHNYLSNSIDGVVMFSECAEPDYLTYQEKESLLKEFQRRENSSLEQIYDTSSSSFSKSLENIAHAESCGCQNILLTISRELPDNQYELLVILEEVISRFNGKIFIKLGGDCEFWNIQQNILSQICDNPNVCALVENISDKNIFKFYSRIIGDNLDAIITTDATFKYYPTDHSLWTISDSAALLPNIHKAILNIEYKNSLASDVLNKYDKLQDLLQKAYDPIITKLCLSRMNQVQPYFRSTTTKVSRSMQLELNALLSDLEQFSLSVKTERTLV